MDTTTLVNAIVVFGYLIGTIVFGVYLSRYVKKDEDFFLAGRSLNQWVIAGTVMATNVAAIYLVGPAGAAYAGGGVSVLLIAWTGNMIAAASALFFVPRLRRIRITTVSEFLEQRYGLGLRLLPAALWIVYYALFAGNAMYTLSVVLKPLLGVSTTLIIFIVSGSVILYCYFSGLIAAAYSAVLQSFLMIIGGLILLPLALREVGGVGEFTRQVPPDFFVFWKAGEVWPTYKDIIMFTLLGLPYWCTSQYMLQRSFAGRSVRHASRGLIIAALITGPLTLSYIIPGICGSLLYGGESALSNTDLVLPKLLMDILPIGLGGLIVAALVAASNSTASALLNSLATLTEHDFYRRFKPGKTSAHYLWIGRLATAIGGVVGLIFALNVEHLGGIIKANFKIMSFFEPPIFVIVAAALFWRRTNALGAALSVLSGITFSAITAFGYSETWSDADRAIWAFPICIVAVIIGTLLGNLVKPPSAERKAKMDELAQRIRGIKPDFSSRKGIAGIVVALVSLAAFVLCAFYESALPKPHNVLIFMGLMMTFVAGCYFATVTFVPDESEGLETEEGALSASWVHRYMGNGWTWLGVYTFAVLLVIVLYAVG